jgi:hypothetical protein
VSNLELKNTGGKVTDFLDNGILLISPEVICSKVRKEGASCVSGGKNLSRFGATHRSEFIPE